MESHGIKVFIEPMALFNVVGTTMDWEETEMSSEFTFKNPNSKGECGCGESFTVQQYFDQVRRRFLPGTENSCLGLHNSCDDNHTRRQTRPLYPVFTRPFLINKIVDKYETGESKES